MKESVQPNIYLLSISNYRSLSSFNYTMIEKLKIRCDDKFTCDNMYPRDFDQMVKGLKFLTANLCQNIFSILWEMQGYYYVVLFVLRPCSIRS